METFAGYYSALHNVDFNYVIKAKYSFGTSLVLMNTQPTDQPCLNQHATNQTNKAWSSCARLELQELDRSFLSRHTVVVAEENS